MLNVEYWMAINVDAAVPTLYDVSTVHVLVADANDNQPVFTTGNDTGAIQLSSAVDIGHVVARVTASDADIGLHARLSYSLVNGNDLQNLFVIDKESGEVTVAAPLPNPGRDVTYNLLVSVSDAGTPPLSSRMTLPVLVTETPRHSAVEVVSRRSALLRVGSFVDATGWIVAGGCVAGGLVVTVFTLCLLVGCSKRRRRKRRRRRQQTNATTATMPTTTPQTASLSRRMPQAPPPLALTTDVDPLTSAMLRRHQFDDVTVLERAAGLRSAGECGNYVNYYILNSTESGTMPCKSAPVSMQCYYNSSF